MANYRGANGIEFVSHGSWSDPELVWEGLTFNYWDIENALWAMFCEEIGEETGLTVYQIEDDMDKYEDMFDEYVQENAAWYLQDVVAGGYFDN